MMNINRTVRLLITLGFVCSNVLGAQTFPEAAAMRALTEARSLKCTFPWYASADWDADQPEIKNASQKEFEFQIDGIEYRTSRARFIGNAGADDLIAIQGTDSVSFIERVPVGSVNVTTVYAWRNKAGNFKAVHSRHTAIGGPSPSQNYGYCQVW